MRLRTRTVLTVALVPGLTTTALLALTVAPALAAGCYVSANRPTYGSSTVYAVVNRAGCGDSVILQSHIKYQKAAWPDPQMGYGEARRTNGSVQGQGPCNRYGRGYYYSQAKTDTGQQSPTSQTLYAC